MAAPRRSPAPILLLRPGEGTGGRGEGGFPRVVVPLDGSATEDRMIEHAIAVAGQAEYILLRVLAADESPLRAVLPQRGETPSSRTQRATVEASLGSRAEALRSRGLAAASHIAVHDSPARAILDYAAESDASLVAMATRSRGGLERALLGSVVSVARIAVGAHFFSDTVMSFFVMLIVADVLYYYVVLTDADRAQERSDGFVLKPAYRGVVPAIPVP